MSGNWFKSPVADWPVKDYSWEEIMIPEELFYSACNAVNNQEAYYLTFLGKKPKGFPKGMLCNSFVRDGVLQKTYSYNPLKVLAWVVANFPQYRVDVVEVPG